MCMTMGMLFFQPCDVWASLQGKTSIIKALMSKSNTAARINEDARTVGINIKKWKPCPNSSVEKEASLSFSVLDLAGQAIYALSHQVSFAGEGMGTEPCFILLLT
jgi:hypothetical protein